MSLTYKRVVATAAVALAASVGVATTAFAGESTGAASHIIAGGTSYGQVLNGKLTLAYDCTATATGAVVSMSITKCQISTGGSNQTIALPGNTATVAGKADVPLAPYTLCINAVATYVDSSTRPISTCQPLLPLNGVPQTTLAVN